MVIDGYTQKAMDSYEVHNCSVVPNSCPLTMPKLAISLANHLASLKQLDAESFRDTIDQAQMMLPRDVHIYHSERDICISIGDSSFHKRTSIGSYPKGMALESLFGHWMTETGEKGDEIPWQVSLLSAVGDSTVEMLDPNKESPPKCDL